MARSTPLGVAIIGLGSIATERHLPVLMKHPGLCVVGAAELDSQRGQWIARQFQIPKIVTEPQMLIASGEVDLVAIFTPPATHASLAHAALDAGKHVFVEKPLTLTLQEAEQLSEHAARAGLQLIVGFNQRHHRLVIKARAWLDAQRLGEIAAVHSILSNCKAHKTANAWREKSNEGGDLNFDLGVHHYDLWSWLLRSPVATVMAQHSVRETQDRTLMLLAKMENRVTVTAIFAENTAEQDRIEIFGTEGQLVLSLYRFDGFDFVPRGKFDGEIGLRLAKLRETVFHLPAIVERMSGGGDYPLSYSAEWDALANTLMGQTGNLATVRDGVEATRVAVAVQESLETGAPVQVRRHMPEQSQMKVAG